MIREIVYFLLVVFVLMACSKTSTHNSRADFSPGVKVHELTNDTLDEISGMESSVSNPGMFWVHNDSGGKPEIYLIDSTLQIRMQVKLMGIKNRDWEDIALGPGPEAGKFYVYVGEIGDNRGRHKSKKIYRFEEPVLSDMFNVQLTVFDTIEFTLADKKKDMEALMIDPATNDLYLISKREEPVYLYCLKYPQSTTKVSIATAVCSLPFTQITAADISNDGSEIVIKNYEYLYYWRRTADERLESALQKPPTILSYTQEPQGEAITFAHDAAGLFSISESSNINKTYLMYYARRSTPKSVNLQQ